MRARACAGAARPDTARGTHTVAHSPRGWTGARTPSAQKRVRTAERRREINQPRKSAAKTLVTKALKVATGQAEGDPNEQLAEAISALDRAAKAGAIHPNAAARRKSRLTRKVNAALGGVHVQTGKVQKATGKAAAAKAAKARVAASKAAKAKAPQTAAGKARAALTKAGRTETAQAAPAAATTATKAPAGKTTKAAAGKSTATKTTAAKPTKTTAAKTTAAKTTAAKTTAAKTTAAKTTATRTAKPPAKPKKPAEPAS
jgi:ribosomal protein S20